jgi:hypothetical protein
MLKAPGTKRLKLNCDELFSSFAFNFNLSHYSAAQSAAQQSMETVKVLELELLRVQAVSMLSTKELEAQVAALGRAVQVDSIEASVESAPGCCA